MLFSSGGLIGVGFSVSLLLCKRGEYWIIRPDSCFAIPLLTGGWPQVFLFKHFRIGIICLCKMCASLSTWMEDSTNKNYTLDNYERAIRECRISHSLLIDYVDALAKNGYYKDALDVAVASCNYGELLRDQVKNLSRYLTDNWITAGIVPYEKRVNADPFSCSKCCGLLIEAVTLSCGHTVCRKCIGPDYNVHCVKCGTQQMCMGLLKTSVIVSTLVEKWWTPQLQAFKLRNNGNRCFADKCYPQALQNYNEAAKFEPNDFVLLSNRSNLYYTMGKLEEALKDADTAIRHRPDWHKGYYRRATVLNSMGRHEDALVAFLQCAALDRTGLAEIYEEVTKVLHKIITSTARQSQLFYHAKGLYGCSLTSEESFLSGGSEEDSVSSGEDVMSANSKTSHRFHERAPQDIECQPKLHKLIDRLTTELERLKHLNMEVHPRSVDASLVEKSDFECTLCYRLMWQPVTTPCGHTYCRSCLDRCLDHNPSCPLCKTSLEHYLALRIHSVTEFVEFAMSTFLPAEYQERRRINEEEINELAASDKLPIFVCTMAFPGVRCPLHIFEPRYRLMIRRCMETGTRRFGMCAYFEDQPNGFPEYGTLLEIREIDYFPDGRSVVDTVGIRRFKILSRAVLDGYHTAHVEYLVDQPINLDRQSIVISLHDRLREAADSWVSNSAPEPLRQRILNHFGTLPLVENDWLSLPNGPAWLWWLIAILPLDPKAQLAILSMTSLEKRLETVQRVMDYVRRRTT